MKYVTVQEMIAIEKESDQAGHTYEAMMEEAGRGLAVTINLTYGEGEPKKALALVGSGNNGGDALVALDYLARWGWEACALLLREREPGDHLVARLQEGGGRVVRVGSPDDYPAVLGQELRDTSVLVDGVLGTGVKLPLREPLLGLLGLSSKILGEMAHPPAVVAVDCPSGVDCDSGEISPVCLRADLTVSMAAVKAGMLKFPAYPYLGDLKVVDIGLPADLPAWIQIKREIIEGDWVAEVIPPRPENAHKGTFGTVLDLAGSPSYAGAALLSGKSAYRVGAGLVTMAVPESIYPALVEAFPEATWIVLEEGQEGIEESAVGAVEDALGRPTACLIGPGWEPDRSTGLFLDALLEIGGLPPLVIDAGGLRLLAGLDSGPHRAPAGSVLTPHPGEMSALCGLSVKEIQADRVGSAERFAREWDQIVLLKGAHTVIANPQGDTRILVSADPSLARAGSGDVLAGIIAGLIAQGVDPFFSAAAGAWLHARAGGLAAEKCGSPAAVLAGEISEQIGWALSLLPDQGGEKNRPAPTGSRSI